MLYLESSQIWRWRVTFEDHGLQQVDEAGKNQAEGGRTKGDIITSKKTLCMSNLGQNYIMKILIL